MKKIYGKYITYKGKKYIDKDIVSVSVGYINFDGLEQTGTIEVHKDVVDDVVNIFKDIVDIKFPIFQINPISNYKYSDRESVIANNTSAYNFRFVNGSTKLSDHAIGLAIDINPKQNPWVHPSAFNLFKYVPGTKGTIEIDSAVIDIFKKYGWAWGGDWKNPDYQHFFKTGDVNKNIKNSLYKNLKIKNPYIA